MLTKRWHHPIVRHKMVAYYAAGAYGPDWEKPTAEQLLEIAARAGEVASVWCGWWAQRAASKRKDSEAHTSEAGCVALGE